jgi:tetratricopeptide (TPR) repeat protein
MRRLFILILTLFLLSPAVIKAAAETLPVDTTGDTASVEEPGLPVVTDEPEMPDVQEGLTGSEPALPSLSAAKSETGTSQVTPAASAEAVTPAAWGALPVSKTAEIETKASPAAAKSGSDEGKKLFISGKTLYKSGRYEDALVDLKKAQTLYAKNKAPQSLTDIIALCVSKIKKKQLAIEALDKGAEKAYNASEYKKAMGLWQKIVTIDPSNTDAAARILKAASDLKAACDSLKAAAQSSLADGNVVEAAAQARKLQDLDPSNHEGDDLLKYMDPQIKAASKKFEIEAIEDYTSKKYNEAIAIWEKMLVLDPSNAELSDKIRKTKEKLKNIDSMTSGK